MPDPTDEQRTAAERFAEDHFGPCHDPDCLTCPGCIKDLAQLLADREDAAVRAGAETALWPWNVAHLMGCAWLKNPLANVCDCGEVSKIIDAIARQIREQ